MVMVLMAAHKNHAPPGRSMPEWRSATFNLGSKPVFGNPTLGAAIPHNEKAGTLVPASSSSISLVFEKDLPLLFLLRRLFRFLLGGLLFRFRLFCLFLRRGFLLRRFLGGLFRPRLGRKRPFLRLFSYAQHILLFR